MGTPDLFTRFADIVPQMAAAFSNPIHVSLAAIPAFCWLVLFFRKQPEHRLASTLVFAGGMASVLPLLLLKYELLATEHALVFAVGGGLLAVVAGALWTGLYEEWIKQVVAKKARNYFCCIDDVIEFSIIAALGFAFAENVWYFHSQSLQPGGLTSFVVVYRSVGSMFLHVFASGIFGYYAGLAFFAKGKLLRDNEAGIQHRVINRLHRLFHVRSSTVFASAKFFEGVLLAAVLHGGFNSLIGLAEYLPGTLGQICLALTVPFLIAGFFWLNYLLDKTEDHKVLNQV